MPGSVSYEWGPAVFIRQDNRCDRHGCGGCKNEIPQIPFRPITLHPVTHFKLRRERNSTLLLQCNILLKLSAASCLRLGFTVRGHFIKQHIQYLTGLPTSSATRHWISNITPRDCSIDFSYRSTEYCIVNTGYLYTSNLNQLILDTSIPITWINWYWILLYQ